MLYINSKALRQDRNGGKSPNSGVSNIGRGQFQS